jgi:H+-transporting ATPase
MEWVGNPQWQAWIPLTRDQVQTALFLQLVAGGHLLLFVVRSRGRFFLPPLPAQPLVLAVLGTQLFAVLMCGFGWFVKAMPWTIIGLVWLYMIAWMFVLDEVKLAVYRKISHGQHSHPGWYAQFLRGRSAGSSLGSARSSVQ